METRFDLMIFEIHLDILTSQEHFFNSLELIKLEPFANINVLIKYIKACGLVEFKKEPTLLDLIRIKGSPKYADDAISIDFTLTPDFDFSPTKIFVLYESNVGNGEVWMIGYGPYASIGRDRILNIHKQPALK